ncbi:AMP-dependent synthetase [Streptacidiphilus pinicola]|uniref:AMP-dependent synthetase n=1 Tax=Streptacidiphilus pinicola TaxID=2219663 RepID=A0A2X0IJN9_9ACTN|nr:AMP-binding protein [Streptacidiphilus pinicola]RAG85334.1 AMP-dependent synthetase [Streptacidiphilus pinicola]
MPRPHPSADNLYQLLMAPADAGPDRPAVVEADENGVLHEISYRRLDALVKQYAAVLDGLGLDVGDPVVVEADTCAAAVAMLLACSLLGLPFVTVSPHTPDTRLATIIDQVTPALHARANDLPARELDRHAEGSAVFDLGGLVIERAPAPRVRRRREVLSTDTAYIVFTSGSTGRPKGVVMSHRAIVTFLRAMLADQLAGPADRVASTSPLQFDFALFGIGVALSAGAALVPVRREDLGSPRRMTAFLRDAKATQVHGVPSLWRPVLRHDPDLLLELTHLRSVVFAGEEFPLPELRRLQEMLPAVRLVNGYGATESMAASFTDVPNPLPADQERLSIGRAHAGAEMTLVDADGRIVTEPGGSGEIYLRSPALFTGYWNDPEATAKVLVPDPVEPRHGTKVLRTGDLARLDETGELCFIGRADFQVQIRGNRVELGEIEGTLTRLPGVTAAAATVVPRGGDQILMAAVTLTAAAAAADFDASAALAFVGKQLPSYMVPRSVRVLPELPLTQNGKVDREALTRRLTAPRRTFDVRHATNA